MKSIEEKELVGHWFFQDGRIVGDETENRIWDLVRNRFTRVAERMSGWVILYQDPCDGSYWELSLPQGELQGGGPARLLRLSEEQARVLYSEKEWP